jgi:hypothetical protein
MWYVTFLDDFSIQHDRVPAAGHGLTGQFQMGLAYLLLQADDGRTPYDFPTKDKAKLKSTLKKISAGGTPLGKIMSGDFARICFHLKK